MTAPGTPDLDDRSVERAKTDDSLRSERQNTDDVLTGERATAERSADEVVEEARAVADAVLSTARRVADEPAPGQPGEGAGAVAAERAHADRTVRGERAAADHVLRGDRREQASVLAALLVHERAATDAYLLTERARSDDAVDHRDDFLAMVAHDVRNLLNGVVLSLDLLLPSAQGAATPEVSAAAARIRRYVARMNRLIGDLVDVTSIDAGRLAVVPVAADAASLAAEAVETFQPAALEQGVTLVAKLSQRPLSAFFDHDRMLQVLANVIANAVKFTPRGGHVLVRADAIGGGIQFCVSDTGAGIPATKLEAIFERFWQVGTNDRRGQGLGLYISKCIVLAHQGRIWAESQVGLGTQVYFTLPR